MTIKFKCPTGFFGLFKPNNFFYFLKESIYLRCQDAFDTEVFRLESESKGDKI